MLNILIKDTVTYERDEVEGESPTPCLMDISLHLPSRPRQNQSLRTRLPLSEATHLVVLLAARYEACCIRLLPVQSITVC